MSACTIATSLIHSKIDYCNSLLLNLPATQTNRLQLVFHQNCDLALPNIRNTYTTAHNIATDLILKTRLLQLALSEHPGQTQFNRSQLILNYSARAVFKSPKFCHITPLLDVGVGSFRSTPSH